MTAHDISRNGLPCLRGSSRPCVVIHARRGFYGVNWARNWVNLGVHAARTAAVSHSVRSTTHHRRRAIANCTTIFRPFRALYLTDLSILRTEISYGYGLPGAKPCESLDGNGRLGVAHPRPHRLPLYVALVGVSRSAPLLAFGLFAGLIADRTNRWVVML